MESKQDKKICVRKSEYLFYILMGLPIQEWRGQEWVQLGE